MKNRTIQNLACVAISSLLVGIHAPAYAGKKLTSKKAVHSKAKTINVSLDACIAYEDVIDKNSFSNQTEELRSDPIKLAIKVSTASSVALQIYRSTIATLRPADPKQAQANIALLAHVDKTARARFALLDALKGGERTVIAEKGAAISSVRTSGEPVRTSLKAAGLWACGELFAYG